MYLVTKMIAMLSFDRMNVRRSTYQIYKATVSGKIVRADLGELTTTN